MTENERQKECVAVELQELRAGIMLKIGEASLRFRNEELMVIREMIAECLPFHICLDDILKKRPLNKQLPEIKLNHLSLHVF